MSTHRPHRLLIVDEDAAVRRDIARTLGQRPPGDDLAALERRLFGAAPTAADASFRVDGFARGDEALEAARAAAAANEHYAMAFIGLDVSHGPTALATLARLRELQPDLPVVLMAPHSADPFVDTQRPLRGLRQVIVLRKPFEPQVLRQLAEAWSVDRSGPEAERAPTDQLTGLSLRPEFDRAVEAAVLSARADGERAALITVDVDHLHVVNEIAGTRGGDRVLALIAQMLRDSVGEGALVARYAGDEFRVLCRACPPDAARSLAETLRERIEIASFPMRRRDVTLTASVGLVLLDEDTGEAARALRAVETACRLAHRQGGNRVIEMGCADRPVARTVAQARWSARLKDALAGSGFVLYAQPIRAIAPVAGAPEHDEVLLRMMNARGRLVSPRRFLPAAQRYNLAPDIDLWVLHSVLLWLEQNPGTRQLSVNLSGRTLGDPGALEAIAALVEAHAGVASRLGFEVTESATIGHLGMAREFMLRVAATGARFALDDFGVGLSSFAYLEQLPVRALKIDKHFVRGARGSVAKRAILNAFSDIGRALGLDTVGEGVEDAETLALLAGAGVQYAQGYFVGRPAQLAGLATVREADPSKVVPLRSAPGQERRKQ